MVVKQIWVIRVYNFWYKYSYHLMTAQVKFSSYLDYLVHLVWCALLRNLLLLFIRTIFFYLEMLFIKQLNGKTWFLSLLHDNIYWPLNTPLVLTVNHTFSLTLPERIDKQMRIKSLDGTDRVILILIVLIIYMYMLKSFLDLEKMFFTPIISPK